MPRHLPGSHVGTAPADPHPPGFSWTRFGGVFAGAVVFLGVGAALATFCFSLNSRPAPAPASSPPQEGPPGTPTAETPVVTLTADERAPISSAIVRAVRFLKITQGADGTWRPADHPLGHAALPALVLLECGLPAVDPGVQKAADFVRRTVPSQGKTYELSLALLFLDRLADPKDGPLIRTLALRLVAGQTRAGAWDYQCPALNAEQEKQLLTTLQSLGVSSFTDWTKSHPEELSRLPAGWKGGGMAALQDLQALKDADLKAWTGDNSNTQFATLALWAARRHDVPVGRSLTLMARHFRATHNPDGSWPYSPGNQIVTPPYSTMTAAGLLGVAIGQGLTGQEAGQGGGLDRDPAVTKAFTVLAGPIGRPVGGQKNRPKVPLANLYYLWSVERVAVIYNRPTLEGKDWYRWGAQMLLDNQDPTRGCWQGGGYPGSNETIDTCFAVLFLRLANLARDLTDKLKLHGGPR